MIAVCGIGNPNGLRNSATTAYQSARPPIVAASANAATKPNTGCTCSKLLAVMNTARVPASTSVASALTRRNSAARAASPGASNENVPDAVMAAFRADRGWRGSEESSFSHGERSEAIQSDVGGAGWIASSLALLAMTKDATISARQKE